jgi:hypothetical protein
MAPQVCAYFENVIKNSVALQYAIELDIYGYEDGPYSDRAPKDVSTRLHKLRQHVDAWNNLDWVESRVSIPNLALHLIRKGMYISLGQDASVTCIQLPSRIRDLPLRTWTLHNIGLSIQKMAADPQSDLLVLAAR